MRAEAVARPFDHRPVDELLHVTKQKIVIEGGREFIQPFVIGVGGGSGSGKTCVSNLIRHRYKDTAIC